MDTKKLDSCYVANTYARTDLFAEKGSGATITDENGKEYIDLASGIAVNSFGACDKIWQQAVISQASQLQHISNLYYTRPQAELAQILCEKTGMKKVFFSNSGAEANECAIKCARKYSHDKYGENRYNIVTLVSSFHGRTMATLSATGQEAMHVHFGPFLGGFSHVPADDFAAMEAACDESVCAVMIELVQGEGGVTVLDRAYVKQVETLCKEKDILLIVDEVQTGNGRTGSLYAFTQFGITPDIVSTAKGLAGGLPLGACLFGGKTEDTLSFGTHGSTFGGNPVCAAAAISIIKRLDDDLFAEVAAKGQYIKNALSNSSGVKSISGMGLMLGIETEKNASEIVKAALEKGVITLTAKTKLRLLPPLSITYEELDKALGILKGVINA